MTFTVGGWNGEHEVLERFTQEAIGCRVDEVVCGSQQDMIGEPQHSQRVRDSAAYCCRSGIVANADVGSGVPRQQSSKRKVSN